MQNLRYVGKNLFLERLSIQNFLKRNKTPFYIYSENQIVSNYSNFVKTFKKTNPLICFAAKSNSNTNILKIISIDYKKSKKIGDIDIVKFIVEIFLKEEKITNIEYTLILPR